MGFNTLAFVFAFLPLFLAAFYLVPARWRTALLCLGSLVFYAIGVWKRPWCLAPLLGLAALVYFLGRGMQPRKSRGLLVLGLAARDQMTASLDSVPLVLLAVLPMMGRASETVGRVASYGPTGGMADLLALLVEGRLWTSDAVIPLVLLVAWTVLGAVVFALLFKRLTRDN